LGAITRLVACAGGTNATSTAATGVRVGSLSRGRRLEGVNVRAFSHLFAPFSHPVRTPEMACLQGKRDQEASSLFGCDQTPGCVGVGDDGV
jgi:hypothetical protein